VGGIGGECQVHIYRADASGPLGFVGRMPSRSRKNNGPKKSILSKEKKVVSKLEETGLPSPIEENLTEWDVPRLSVKGAREIEQVFITLATNIKGGKVDGVTLSQLRGRHPKERGGEGSRRYANNKSLKKPYMRKRDFAWGGGGGRRLSNPR